MTRLLVSVRDLEEFRRCCAAGVDVIDFKEPRRGPLAGTSPELWLRAIEELSDRDRTAISPAGTAISPAGTSVSPAGTGEDRRPPPMLSVAMGELIDREQGTDRTSLAPLPDRGISFAKLGLAGTADRNWQSDWDRWRRELGGGAEGVLVAYADAALARSPEPDELLAFAIERQVRMLLVDTFDKRRGDLLTSLAPVRLERLLAEAHEQGISVALAGSLVGPALEQVLELRPDLIAVRGAACRTDRTGEIDPERLDRLVALRDRLGPSSSSNAMRASGAARSVDWRGV